MNGKYLLYVNTRTDSYGMGNGFLLAPGHWCEQFETEKEALKKAKETMEKYPIQTSDGFNRQKRFIHLTRVRIYEMKEY